MAHPHHLRTRVGAVALALLASLAAPSAALAHGVAHGHLRTAHHASTAAASDHEHSPDRHAVRMDDGGHEVRHAPPPAHGDHGDPADPHRHGGKTSAPAGAEAHDVGTIGSPASPSARLAPAGDSHRHAHPLVDRAAGPRDLWRLAVTALDSPLPASRLFPDLAVVEHAPAVPERACLARPDPESGPPPTPRAPPALN